MRRGGGNAFCGLVVGESRAWHAPLLKGGASAETEVWGRGLQGASGVVSVCARRRAYQGVAGVARVSKARQWRIHSQPAGRGAEGAAGGGLSSSSPGSGLSSRLRRFASSWPYSRSLCGVGKNRGRETGSSQGAAAERAETGQKNVPFRLGGPGPLEVPVVPVVLPGA